MNGGWIRALVARVALVTLVAPFVGVGTGPFVGPDVGAVSAGEPDVREEPIRPHPRHPRYWEHRGKPVLLAGGSVDDNLFQLPDLEKHLDEIHAAGGNYVRNTMSDRPNRGFEVYPFARRSDGKYDLDRWNEEYWDRFDRFLRGTARRGIIVQIEVWDRFDYSRENWTPHPYNPGNNVNYTAKESGLAATYPKHPGANEQPFFFTVPALRNNEVLLRYQRGFVDKLLSSSLRHGHVLYCMDNETAAEPAWGEYWARHIRKRAREAGVEVHVTEMWDAWDLKHAQHRRTFDRPDLYTFVDVSQNNHNRGQKHWDNLAWVRGYLGERPRPMNCVKIYGADGGKYGSTRDGQERFWRDFLGGAASSRFHRPPAGIGLSEAAKPHVRSLRMVEAEFDFFRAEPDARSRTLGDRASGEAFLTRIPGEAYLVYFPDGGTVTLDLAGLRGAGSLRWLEVERSRWRAEPTEVAGGRTIRITSPGRGHWLCLVRRTTG